MAETTSYARSKYSDIIDSILFDVNETEKLYPLPKEELKRWLTEAEKDICERLPVTDQVNLRLLKGVEDYLFADSSGIVGTGTLTASGANITGVGTIANTELLQGSKITIGIETRRVVTVTDDLTFTIESAFSNPVTNATFTISPRSTEITTETFQIYYIDRLQNGNRFTITVRDIDSLLRERAKYIIPSTNTIYGTPCLAAPYIRNGRRYLKVYPSPEIDKTITLWIFTRINPRFHVSDVLTDTISLDEMYEPAINNYVKMNIYSFLKDQRLELKWMQLYNQEVKQLQASLPNDSRIQMVYQ